MTQTMTIKAPLVEDIRAGFLYSPVDKIIGEPKYQNIDHLHNQVIWNAATLKSMLGGGNNGLDGLISFPPTYFVCTAHNFIPPTNPGKAPTYPQLITAAQRQAILTQHEIALKNYCQQMDLLLKNEIEKCMDTMWLADIYSNTHGFGGQTCVDIIQYLFQTYGRISPNQITANIQRLNAPVDPTQPITMIWKQIEDRQKFATSAAFTPPQLVTAAETLLLSTNHYKTAYRNWMAQPPTNRTYANKKVHFNQESQLQNTIKTTRKAGYQQMHNAADVKLTSDTEASLEEAVHNFATATAAD